MNNKRFIFFICLIICSCKKEKTDLELLQKDKSNLEECLKTDEIAKYKFLKIAMRSSVPMENYPSEFLPFKDKLNDLSNTLKDVDTENISFLEMASIYKDYLDLKKVIDKTDEDVFPTLIEAMQYTNSEEKMTKQKLLAGDEKKKIETYEHAFLGIIGVISKSFGKSITLYESSKINPENIEDAGFKMIFQYYRGLIFMEKSLYYLSENEATKNIDWLNTNQKVDLQLIQTLFGWNNFDKEQNYIAFHSLNYLLRGIDRLSMERDIDEERGLDDFEVFLEDCNTLGLNNELSWSIDAYVSIKRENNQKAIVALKKLKNSSLLSKNDKEQIEETIRYLENRKQGEWINTVYDKAFISKIVISYVTDQLSKMDWEKILNESNIQDQKEVLLMIENFKKCNEKIQEVKDMKYLEENATKIQEEGSKIWDKAKDLIQ
ncbi:short-chain dehydrogenase [Flavobacterium sp. J27]|uniref:short-chain dehydrogenase n=1 Tax=Flavobacterium sp. J27 TaxID=2060419 RepID=UPI00103122F6|nr:short-chain dehydrogenase [Flavobacterium sp. J27]